jgi:protein tyrosine phosphatase (PTP) superfamily phosphohydrolase (DUF442 family)
MKTEKPRRWAALLVAVLTVLGACGGPAEEGAEPEAALAAAAPTLADLEALGIPNAAMPLPHVLTMGQPTEEQLTALVNLGYTNFISLRASSEEGTGWEEGITCDEGIQLARLPVSGPEDLTREKVMELDRLLAQAGNEGTVIYCATGNRAAALLALRAYWLEGVDPRAALELGRRAGLGRWETAVSELLAAPR